MAPLRVSSTAGDKSYIDIRVGGGDFTVHQIKADISELGANVDADGYLKPGTPLRTTGAIGAPITGAGQGDVVLVGPEPVRIGAADHTVNAFFAGVFSRQAIEANLGRVLTADELASIAATPGLRLI